MKTKIILISAFLLSMFSIKAQQVSARFYETNVNNLLYCGDTVCITHLDSVEGYAKFYFNTKNIAGGLTKKYTLTTTTVSAPAGIDTTMATSYCWRNCYGRGVNTSQANLSPNDTVEGASYMEYYPFIGAAYDSGVTPFVNGYATVVMTLHPEDEPKNVTTLTVIFAIGVPEITTTPKTEDLCPTKDTLPSVKIKNYNNTIESRYYPNPTQNNINIVYEKPVKGKINIINNNGQIVAKANINNENNISINVENLPIGTYTCSTIADSKTINTFKFIKK